MINIQFVSDHKLGSDHVEWMDGGGHLLMVVVDINDAFDRSSTAVDPAQRVRRVLSRTGRLLQLIVL